MKKIRFLLVVILALCLVNVDSITVPSRGTFHSDLRFVNYDAGKREFTDYGMRMEIWCQNASGLGRDLCVRPDFIPAEDRLLFSLRDDFFKETSWQYAAAFCSTYRPKARQPGWEFDVAGNIRYVFDCSPMPFKPPGFEIVMHSEDRFVWDSHRIKLYLPQKQKGVVRGFDLMTELAGVRPLNGTALEYLLAVPRLLLKDWYGRQVLFLGTVLKSHSGVHYAAKLCCSESGRFVSLHQLDYEVHANSMVAAVLV